MIKITVTKPLIGNIKDRVIICNITLFFNDWKLKIYTSINYYYNLMNTTIVPLKLLEQEPLI